MSCNGCSNGCVEITSDNCIKYTGVNIPQLNITQGDSLAQVISNITEYLQNTLDASGITWTIDPAKICSLIDQYLPETYNLTEIVEAVFDAICDLQTQVTEVASDMTTLNADYDVDCLQGVTDSSDTHTVLQATVTTLCNLISMVEALTLDLSNNYVQKTLIDDYINAWFQANGGTSSKHYLKMVPYVAVPYFGNLDSFSTTGAGQGDWEKVYLCNGQNNTPDLRGRILVGTTVMGNNSFDNVVNPSIAGNPTYDLNTKFGANNVTLTTSQIPSHTHNSTGSVTIPPHSHSVPGIWGQDNGDHSNVNRFAAGDVTNASQYFSVSTSSYSGETANLNISVANMGGGESHNNIPPVHACHYIIYIP